MPKNDQITAQLHSFHMMYSAYKLKKIKIKTGWQCAALAYSFPNFEPVHGSMSGSNCCFLTCIQVSQEAGLVVWYSHLFQNFLQFIVIHTVKDFGHSQWSRCRFFFFWNSLAFSMIQQMVAIWSLVPLPFLNPAWTTGSSRFTYCWSWLGELWALLY